MTEQTPDGVSSAADDADPADAAATIADLQRQLVHWRAQALRGWAQEATGATGGGSTAAVEEARRAADEAHRVAAEALAQVEDMRRSTSWRVTAPLRAVTGALRSRRGR